VSHIGAHILLEQIKELNLNGTLGRRTKCSLNISYESESANTLILITDLDPDTGSQLITDPARYGNGWVRIRVLPLHFSNH
jgi:hypothetical protein